MLVGTRTGCAVLLALLASLNGSPASAQTSTYPVTGGSNYAGSPGWPPDLLPPYELLPRTLSAPAEALPAPDNAPVLQLETEIELDEASGFESWVLPSYWFSAVDWDGGVEIGINGTEGNSDALSVRTGFRLKRKTKIEEVFADLLYVKATSEGIETQNNGIAKFGYERFFGDSPWTFFVKEFLEYDEFKDFDLRLAINGGIGYMFVKSETTTLQGTFGAGVSHEVGGSDDSWTPEALAGLEFVRQLTKRQKLAIEVDYLPAWTDLDNYRLVTDLAWEVLLDEEHNLNLKLSINDRYDSTPNGRRPNDLIYGLVLLWKL